MAFKDLLVLVDNDAQCVNRLRYASEMAGHLQARLRGVYVRRQLDIPAYAEVHVPPEAIAAGEQALAEMADEARERFRETVEARLPGSELEVLEGDFARALGTSIRYADVAILAQRHPDASDLNVHYSPASILLQAGRPVLLVPHAGAFGFPPRRAAVAWDGSAASTRALHDALPLLQQAAQVLVVCVGEDGEDSDTAHGSGAVSMHLARHGVQAEIRRVQAPDSAAGETLASVAAETGAELVVMGGYGHSRLRELVLGGVTRRMLRHMTVPVLMSH